MRPHLGGLAVADLEDLYLLVLNGLALALGPDRGECNDVLIVSDHVVQLDADGAVRCLERAPEPPDDLLQALIIAAERAPARVMPPDTLGDRIPSAKNLLVSASRSPRPKAAYPSRTRSSLACAIRPTIPSP